MVEIRQTLVFAAWLASLKDRNARARIHVRLDRLALGLAGDVKPVGSGVSELRVDYGPGYRVYLQAASRELVMLLIGGDKRTQSRDIERAIAMARDLWESFMARKKVQTTRYDSAALLKTPGDIAAYLEAAMEDGDPRVIAAALGNIARAKGMSALAREAGLGRESLYKALSPDGNPEFSTILKVVRALGLRLHAEVVSN